MRGPSDNFNSKVTKVDLVNLNICHPVRFSQSVTVSKMAVNICILPLCSIFSLGSHVGCPAEMSFTTFKLVTLRMIVAKFGSILAWQFQRRRSLKKLKD